MKLLTFNPPSNGDTLSVRIDPARKDHVVFTSDAATPASASGLASTPSDGAGVSAADVRSSVPEPLRKVGLGDASMTVIVHPDGSRTTSSTSVGVGGSGSAALGAADTVKLLAEIEKLRESGALAPDEFDLMKRKLLGES
ncbi:MAG: SHOCT domain-containing protein [Candidatus Eremiobacteraeota bacterium]|nr:SHOCT domain-containing protein [Candidatus Eremiobacteraeota bacterium]